MADSWRNNFSSPYLIFLLNVQIIALSLATFMFNKFIFIGTAHNVFLKNYLDDMLAPMLLLAVTNILLHIYRDTFINHLPILMGYMCLVGLFWEYITPLYNKSSVSDPYDLLAYLGGTIVYYLLFNIGYQKLYKVLEDR